MLAMAVFLIAFMASVAPGAARRVCEAAHLVRLAMLLRRIGR